MQEELTREIVQLHVPVNVRKLFKENMTKQRVKVF